MGDVNVIELSDSNDDELDNRENFDFPQSCGLKPTSSHSPTTIFEIPVDDKIIQFDYPDNDEIQQQEVLKFLYPHCAK